MKFFTRLSMYISKLAPFIVVLSFSFNAVAQSRITVSAPDSLAFILFVNGEQINISPCVELTSVPMGPGKINLKAISGYDTEKLVIQDITLKDKTHLSAEIQKVKNDYKFIVVGESAMNAPLIGKSAVSLSENVLTSDTSTSYVGAQGCMTPINADAFNSLKSALSEMHFEIKKLDTMRSFCQNNCIRVDQLRYLLSILELEENKVKLLEYAKSNVYDTDHLPKVEEDFFLQKNKDKVKSMIAG